MNLVLDLPQAPPRKLHLGLQDCCTRSGCHRKQLLFYLRKPSSTHPSPSSASNLLSFILPQSHLKVSNVSFHAMTWRSQAYFQQVPHLTIYETRGSWTFPDGLLRIPHQFLTHSSCCVPGSIYPNQLSCSLSTAQTVQPMCRSYEYVCSFLCLKTLCMIAGYSA